MREICSKKHGREDKVEHGTKYAGRYGRTYITGNRGKFPGILIGVFGGNFVWILGRKHVAGAERCFREETTKRRREQTVVEAGNNEE